MAFVVASTILHPILRGPQRPARVLAVLPSAVYLQVDPVPGQDHDHDQDQDPVKDKDQVRGHGRAGARPRGPHAHPGSPLIVGLLARDAVRVPIGMVVALPRHAAPFAALEPGCTGSIGAGALWIGGRRYQPLRYW